MVAEGVVDAGHEGFSAERERLGNVKMRQLPGVERYKINCMYNHVQSTYNLYALSKC